MIDCRKWILRVISTFLFMGCILPCTDINAQMVTNLHNPQTIPDETMLSGQKTTWDCIFFGSYPQAEVIENREEYIGINDIYLLDEDIIEDASLFQELSNLSEASWNEYNECTYKGRTYKRMNSSDTGNRHRAYYKDDEKSYQWGGPYEDSERGYLRNEELDKSYHFFLVQPIKWLVLAVEEDNALLMSYRGLDYDYQSNGEVCNEWTKSSIKNRLNGYNPEEYYGYSVSFFDYAFTDLEKESLLDANYGDSINDKVTLFNINDYRGENAPIYGFSSEFEVTDEARLCKTTAYAKAMGCNWVSALRNQNTDSYWYIDGKCVGSSAWPLQQYAASDVGGAVYAGNYGDDAERTIRPVIRLSLNNLSVWAYGGRVSSNEKISNYCNHNLVYEEAKNSTCGTEGNLAYWYCEKCEKIYLDENAEKEIISMDSVVVKKKDHIYEEKIIPATTEEDGVSYQECKVCGKIDEEIAIAAIKSVTLSTTSYVYTGVAKEPSVVIQDTEGKVIPDKYYEVRYVNNILPGTASVVVSGKGIYKGTITKKFVIRVIPIDDAKVTLSDTIFTYDGAEKKPAVTVVLGDKTLLVGKDYDLEYSNNISVGTAKVSILAKGNYGGQIDMTYTILPYSAGMDRVYDVNETFIDGNFLYTVMNDEDLEVEFTAPTNKNNKTIKVPATVTVEGVTYRVTSVGEKAFYKNSKITSVTIGNNVKTIDNYAFYGCKNLRTVKFGKNVDVIGVSAFRKCTKLTSVTLPRSVDSLGKNAFYGCSRLKTITINANLVMNVSDNAIKGISKKAVIMVPKNLVKKYQKEFNSKTGFKKTMKIKKK